MVSIKKSTSVRFWGGIATVLLAAGCASHQLGSRCPPRFMVNCVDFGAGDPTCECAPRHTIRRQLEGLSSFSGPTGPFT